MGRIPENQQHSWSDNQLPLTGRGPLLRMWDRYSGSQPDHEDRMLSRAPRQCLNDFYARRDSLTTHISHREWEPTPYISFTSSPADAHEMANTRSYTRGPQYLTVTNPVVRIGHGLPILNAADEMYHYNVQDPYRRWNQYYKDHYLCLWEVTSAEIVGHWRWDSLVTNENWYEEIIFPAYVDHFRRYVDQKPSFQECLRIHLLMDLSWLNSF
jgi:hypothetical protein